MHWTRRTLLTKTLDVTQKRVPVVVMALASSSATCARVDVETSALNDGALHAPAGALLLPDLLTDYPARPPWKVAGVDYPVGVPLGTKLRDASTITVAGASVDLARHIVTVSGNDMTLDGYDFGLDGGWGIDIEPGATNTVIENSHFRVGANSAVPINAAAGAGSLGVQNNTIDGGGGQNNAVWALINYNGSGKFIAQYNAFLNAPSDAIDFSSGTMTTIVRYNVFDNLGTTLGSHPDAVQYVGVHANNSIVAFNTIYQPNPSGMQGVQLEAQNGSTLTNTTIENNTIVAKGAPLKMSYSIAVGQDPGNHINGVLVQNNYIDFSGAYGPFYPARGRNLTFVGNVDMASGRLIHPPFPKNP